MQYDAQNVLFQPVLDYMPFSRGMDTYFMRKVPPAMTSFGFTLVAPLKLYSFVECEKDSYGYNLVSRAIKIYGESETVRYYDNSGKSLPHHAYQHEHNTGLEG